MPPFILKRIAPGGRSHKGAFPTFSGTVKSGAFPAIEAASINETLKYSKTKEPMLYRKRRKDALFVLGSKVQDLKVSIKRRLHPSSGASTSSVSSVSRDDVGPLVAREEQKPLMGLIDESENGDFYSSTLKNETHS